MEIGTYDARSTASSLYNLGPKTMLLIAGLAVSHRGLPKLLDQEVALVQIHRASTS